MAYPISGGEIPRIPSKAEQEQAILENVQKMRRIPQPTPAMEMMYSNVKPIIVYTGKRYVPLPNASEDGKNAKGNVLVMLTPSQNDTWVASGSSLTTPRTPGGTSTVRSSRTISVT